MMQHSTCLPDRCFDRSCIVTKGIICCLCKKPLTCIPYVHKQDAWDVSDHALFVNTINKEVAGYYNVGGEWGGGHKYICHRCSTCSHCLGKNEDMLHEVKKRSLSSIHSCENGNGVVHSPTAIAKKIREIELQKKKQIYSANTSPQELISHTDWSIIWDQKRKHKVHINPETVVKTIFRIFKPAFIESHICFNSLIGIDAICVTKHHILTNMANLHRYTTSLDTINQSIYSAAFNIQRYFDSEPELKELYEEGDSDFIEPFEDTNLNDMDDNQYEDSDIWNNPSWTFGVMHAEKKYLIFGGFIRQNKPSTVYVFNRRVYWECDIPTEHIKNAITISLPYEEKLSYLFMLLPDIQDEEDDKYYLIQKIRGVERQNHEVKGPMRHDILTLYFNNIYGFLDSRKKGLLRDTFNMLDTYVYDYFKEHGDQIEYITFITKETSIIETAKHFGYKTIEEKQPSNPTLVDYPQLETHQNRHQISRIYYHTTVYKKYAPTYFEL